MKLFADDPSLFAIVKDKDESDNTLNNNIMLAWKGNYNWKMLFNPDPSKQAQELLLSKKKQIQIHATINLNNIQVERVPYKIHLGLKLDGKLNV